MPKFVKSYWFLIALLLLTLGFVVIFFLYQLGYSPQNSFLELSNCVYKSNGSISPQWVKEFAGIDLPPTTRDLMATCEAYQDFVAYVKFAIKPVDLPALIASSYIKVPLSTTAIPRDITTDTELQRIGWNIQAIRTYLAGEATTENAKLTHQSILIDTSDDSEYIVYILTTG